MIPKIIHYCWLSGDEYPRNIARCLESWGGKLAGYEFVLWDLNRFDVEQSPWVKQAFAAKKYAFAADYIRLYAVYHYGGIYLDTDVEILKPFDDLLHLPYFVGSEGDGILEAGVFGAEKGTPWLYDCLSHYDNRSFVLVDGSFDTVTLPRIMMSRITGKREIIELSSDIHYDSADWSQPDTLLMFAKDYFCAKDHGTGLIEVTENTYAVHHFAMSWMSPKETLLPNLKRRLMRIFGVGAVNAVIRVIVGKKLCSK